MQLPPRFSKSANKRFQIFAANPKKSPEVQKFLVMNKQKLLKFLPNFLPDRTDDDQFNDEKAWLIKAIGGLPDSMSGIHSPASSQSSGSSQVQQQNGTAQVRS